jgi:hypothetical protein
MHCSQDKSRLGEILGTPANCRKHRGSCGHVSLRPPFEGVANVPGLVIETMHITGLAGPGPESGVECVSECVCGNASHVVRTQGITADLT